jgi:hypothetical protein
MLEHIKCIDTMLSAWNTRDESVLAQVVGVSMSHDVEFCDPHNDIRGHDAFIAMVKAFWAQHGDCKISRASNIDAHHDRARYAWEIDWPDGRRFEGFDAVTLDLKSGTVSRIDGFFGPLSPIQA